MITTALVFACIAALLHVYIFSMESLTWTSEKTRTNFGTSKAEAEATRELAFNQGFYNLFLALAVFIGVIFYAIGQHAIGSTLVFTGVGSMLAASVVLAIGSPKKMKLAVKQGTIPLVAVIQLTIGLLLSN